MSWAFPLLPQIKHYPIRTSKDLSPAATFTTRNTIHFTARTFWKPAVLLYMQMHCQRFQDEQILAYLRVHSNETHVCLCMSM